MAEPTPAHRSAMTSSYHSFLHNTSLAMLFLAPALIALPPRKLDLYTAGLAASFIASANHLTAERTGRGLLDNLPFRAPPTSVGSNSTADKFLEASRAERDQTRLLEEPVATGSASSSATGRSPTALEAAAKELWMGGETDGWRERRLREEQEKIAQGEGYGSMIMDQIWEVWNWEEKKEKEVQGKDKEVLYRREQEEKARRREEEFPTIGGRTEDE